MKEKLPHSRNPLTDGSVGGFGISESNITRRKKKPHRIHTNVYSVMFCIYVLYFYLFFNFHYLYFIYIFFTLQYCIG